MESVSNIVAPTQGSGRDLARSPGKPAAESWEYGVYMVESNKVKMFLWVDSEDFKSIVFALKETS